MSYIGLPLSVILSAIMTKESGVSMYIYDGTGLKNDAAKHRQFTELVGGEVLDLMLEQGRLEITCRDGDPNKFKTIYHTVTNRKEVRMSTKVNAKQLEKACIILYSFSFIPPEAVIRLTDERIILTNKAARNMSVSFPRADRPRVPETGPDPKMTIVDRNFSRALKRASIARSRDKDSPLSDIFLEMSDGRIIIQATNTHMLAKSIVAPISFSNDLQLTHLSVDAQKIILAEQLVRGNTRKSGRICLSPDPDNHQLIMRNPKSGVEVRLPYNEYNPDFFRDIVPDVNHTDITTFFNAYELKQRMGMFKTGKYDLLKIGSAKENDQWLMTVEQKGLIAQGKEQVREFFPFDIATSVACSGGFEERIVRADYLKRILAGTTKDGQLDLQISTGDPRATFRSQDGTFACTMMCVQPDVRNKADDSAESEI